MGDVTMLAPKSRQDQELAALFSTAASLVPIHHPSGITQSVMRNVHSCKNKKEGKENGKIQFHQMCTGLHGSQISFHYIVNAGFVAGSIVLALSDIIYYRENVTA